MEFAEQREQEPVVSGPRPPTGRTEATAEACVRHHRENPVITGMQDGFLFSVKVNILLKTSGIRKYFFNKITVIYGPGCFQRHVEEMQPTLHTGQDTEDPQASWREAQTPSAGRQQDGIAETPRARRPAGRCSRELGDASHHTSLSKN